MKVVVVLLLLICSTCSHAANIRIARDKAIRVRAGAEVIFLVEVSQPVGQLEGRATGSFFDPSVDLSSAPRLPFYFSQPHESDRCNVDFGRDISPLPNFKGWFGAFGIAPGETLQCRVSLIAFPNARPGTYRAALATGAQTIEFDVVIAAALPALVPAEISTPLFGTCLLFFILAGTRALRMWEKR